MTTLRPWPLLLAGEEGVERNVGDLDDLEPDSGDVTDSVALPAETGDQHFVVLLDKVETTVLGHEGGDLLGVLDQLNTDTLPDGGVGLLSLDTDLKQTNARMLYKSLRSQLADQDSLHKHFLKEIY